MKQFKWRYLLAAGVVVIGCVALNKAYSEIKFQSGPLGKLKREAGDVRYAQLTPTGEQNHGGLYDPSVAYAPDGQTGWLAYSAIAGDFKPIGPYVHTRLAQSTNGGQTWEFVKTLNASSDAELTMPGGDHLAGAWRYEVSTLVCDPADPDAERRWKLLVHRYFWAPKKDRMVQYGWIALRTAPDPAADWSDEVPLFGAGQNPLAPYHETRIDLNALDPSLASVVAYSEPGALAHDSKLYLSMTALAPRLGLKGISVGHSIVLLESSDHGGAWRFVRKLLDNDTAAQFGCELFDGSSLAEEDGRFFLLVSPGRSGATHDGTVAFEFASLAEGRLRLDAAGRPEIVAYFAPQPSIYSGPGAGQSAYDQHNTHGGVLMPQFNLKAYPEVFQIYQTGRRITPARARAADDPPAK